jgi:hypothetical protein
MDVEKSGTRFMVGFRFAMRHCKRHVSCMLHLLILATCELLCRHEVVSQRANR